jgi:hypothetical protein
MSSSASSDAFEESLTDVEIIDDRETDDGIS